jgi:Pentapeptide repeats (8 copies)
LIVWVQRTWLALDLVALVWFFARNPLYGGGIERAAILTTQRVAHWGLVTGLPVLIIVLNLWWLRTVPADAEPDVVRYYSPRKSWVQRARDPLDLLLCPTVKWGCRFLRVDHRLLVDKVRDEKAPGVLRMDISKLKEVLSQEAPGGDPEQKTKAEYARAMAAMEGVFLRTRSLRFALLDESQLYAADLIAADLRKASLFHARLQGANLSGADLSGGDLSSARDLTQAQLNEACGKDVKLPPGRT